MEDEVFWIQQWKHPILFSHGKRDSCGVAILINNANIQITSHMKDTNGRLIHLCCQSANSIYQLINLYAPNEYKRREEVFKYVFDTMMIRNTCMNTVIGGDFNTVLVSSKDRLGKSTHTSKVLHEIIEHFDLVDIWRTLNPMKNAYTWKLNNQTQARLDFWLIPPSLVKEVKNCEILPSIILYQQAVCSV